MLQNVTEKICSLNTMMNLTMKTYTKKFGPTQISRLDHMFWSWNISLMFKGQCWSVSGWLKLQTEQLTNAFMLKAAWKSWNIPYNSQEDSMICIRSPLCLQSSCCSTAVLRSWSNRSWDDTSRTRYTATE